MTAVENSVRAVVLLACLLSTWGLPAHVQDKLQSTGKAGSSYPTARSRGGRIEAAATQTTIPRLIHQSWKFDSVPMRFRDWSWTWKALHKAWSYKLQTDRSMRELVEEQYKWHDQRNGSYRFLPTYDQLAKNIKRVDVAPYMLLHAKGGLYIDLDFHALKAHDELFKDKAVVLGSANTNRSEEQSVINTWVASVPGHDLWLFCLEEIARLLEEQQQQRADDPSRFVELVAGPALLTRAIQAYKASSKGADDITILPPGVILPPDGGDSAAGKSNDACSLGAGGFDAQACTQAYPQAYAVAIRPTADGAKPA